MQAELEQARGVAANARRLPDGGSTWPARRNWDRAGGLGRHETAQELAWLAANRCDVVQGYGVARPMPLEEFVDWVENFNQAWRAPWPHGLGRAPSATTPVA
jgi:hypothetical protein